MSFISLSVKPCISTDKTLSAVIELVETTAVRLCRGDFGSFATALDGVAGRRNLLLSRDLPKRSGHGRKIGMRK